MLKFNETPLYKITYKNGYVRYSKYAFGRKEYKSLGWNMEKTEPHKCNYMFIKRVDRVVNGVKTTFAIYKCTDCGRKCEVADE